MIRVHDSGEERCHKHAALFRKPAHLFLNAAAEHEEHGRDNDLVPLKARFLTHIREVHRNALFPETPVKQQHRVNVAHIAQLSRLDPLQCPEILIIKQDTDPGLIPGIQHRLETCKHLSYLRHVPEHPRIRPSVMADHRAMERLRTAASLAPLEHHDTLAPMCHRLQ